jgi:hypothetical protein
MALVACAALAGLFGNGWWSGASAASRTLVIAYPRFARAKAPLDLELEWQPAATEAVLSVDRSYLDLFDIEELRPPPAATAFDSERIHYTFRLLAADGRVKVGLRLRPQRAGRALGAIGVDGEPAVEIRQWILP